MVRKQALETFNDAAKNMPKKELKQQPPSLYYKGETILVHFPTSKKKKTVKGKKNTKCLNVSFSSMSYWSGILTLKVSCNCSQFVAFPGLRLHFWHPFWSRDHVVVQAVAFSTRDSQY